MAKRRQRRLSVTRDRTRERDPWSPAEGGPEAGGPPLSPAQRRIWFLDRVDEDRGAYNIARATRLRGPLRVDALRLAHAAVAERHEILRTRFPQRVGVPTQVVDPPGGLDFVEVDLTTLPTEAREAALAARLHDEANTRFDIANAAAWRVRVLRLGTDEHVLLIVVHHIAADGWSFPVLRAEVARCYRAIVDGETLDLPPLAVQYRDFAVRQLAAADAGEFASSLEFWKDRLGDDPDPLPLPADRPRTHKRTTRGGWIDGSLPETTEEEFRAAARSLEATPFVLGLALFAGFIGRYCAATELVVGIPSAERSWPPAQDLVGPFMNTLPIRLSIPTGATLRELVKVARSEVLDALDHAAVPFEEIVRVARPRRDPSHTPLFQVMYQYRDGTFRSDYELPGITEEVVPIAGATSKFDLTLELGGAAGPVALSLNYSADLFNEDTARHLGESFAVMSEAALADPDAPPYRLPLVTGWERRWLLDDLNDTATAYPKGASIPALYAGVVARHGARVAVDAGVVVVTHSELRDAAAAIAAQLRAAGVRPGEAVGLRMERSPTLVAAMLGVLEADAVYVPLDPSYPEARSAQMIAAAGIRVLVTRPEDGHWSDVELSTAAGSGTPIDRSELPAYVMFTSGSTGTPKGVLIPQRAVLRLVLETDYVRLGPGDVLAHLSNTSFDAATFEVWGALLNGATLAVIDRQTALVPALLADDLRRRSISTVFLTTALFNAVARHAPDAFGSVRDVLFGGEQCDPGAVRAVLEAKRPQRLVHVYGPTEATTFSSWHEVTDVPADSETVPIGLPVANTTLHVLDSAGQLVPPGMLGELYVGGDGLAIGYLDDAALTRERFVPDPFADEPGRRLYRTGDLVRRRADGAIEFVRRIDRQIKVRGFRVEPAEVEAALRAEADVVDAVVRAIEPSGQLAAWVVPGRPDGTSASGLRRALESKLPSFMVPSLFTMVATLPIGPNGKIDVERLPAPVPMSAGAGPSTPTEDRVMRIFGRVLNADLVGRSDSFFDLGGHSLLAVGLIAEIEREFGTRLPLATLFEAPTPSAIAARIDAGAAGPAEETIVPMVSGSRWPPVFVFHHPSGTVLAYKPLAEQIGGGYPVYGIQARGIDGLARPSSTIEEMAAQYAETLVRMGGEGPYRLVGHSLGGLLAWETARRLRAAGHEVSMLALLDTRVPTGWRRHPPRDGDYPLESLVQSVWRLGRRFAGDVRWGSQATWHAARRRQVPPELARVRLLRAASRAFDRYTPGAFDGRVTYFMATAPRDASPARVRAEWAAISAALEIVPVPGGHTGPSSILAEPNVRVLGRELQSRLDTRALVERIS